MGIKRHTPEEIVTKLRQVEVLIGRCLRSLEVIEVLSDAMLFHGIPEHSRSDNGPEMTSKLAIADWHPDPVQSSPARLGRTATTSPSTANSGMNA